MIKKSASLQDVAAIVGVSTNHVSLALRGSPLVASKTALRILKVAAELDYRPNRLVRAIQTGQSGFVGVIIKPKDAWTGGMVCGIHDVLFKHDILPLLDWMPSYPEAPPKKGDRTELEVIHNLLERRVDGIIVFPYSDKVSDLYFKEVWERGIPLVTIDRQTPHTSADFVGTDEVTGGRLAAQHLLDLGHRRIGQIAGFHDYGTYAERQQAFSEAVIKGGGTCVTVEVGQYEDSTKAVHKLMDVAKRPTAVFLGGDNFAPPLYAWAANSGVCIPKELSVIGYADLPVCKLLSPKLSTIQQDSFRIGCEAARMIFERIGRQLSEIEPQKVRLKPRLVVRESTIPIKKSKSH